jgi:flagellar motor switch protein FliG
MTMAKRTAHSLSGARKAALVVASLPTDAASSILARMGRSAAQAVGLELAHLSDLPEGTAEEALREFVDSVRSGGIIVNQGIDRARELLRSALAPQDADEAVARIDEAILERPFRFLADANADTIFAQIKGEQPQTVALVLAHLPAPKAARVLEAFPPRMQGDIVRRVAHMADAAGDAVRRVQDALKARIGHSPAAATTRVGGLEQAADILKRTSRVVERTALDAVDAEEPELADAIRRRLFAFEDLLRADDRGIRALLKEVSTQEISVALKTASEDLNRKFLANLSARARELLADEMEFMRPVRLADVEAAQARILDAARRLEEAGELFVAGRASGEDYVV